MARNKLPDFKQNYEKYQEKIKWYADNRRHVKPQKIKIGDSVPLKKDKKILQKKKAAVSWSCLSWLAWNTPWWIQWRFPVWWVDLYQPNLNQLLPAKNMECVRSRHGVAVLNNLVLAVWVTQRFRNSVPMRQMCRRAAAWDGAWRLQEEVGLPSDGEQEEEILDLDLEVGKSGGVHFHSAGSVATSGTEADVLQRAQIELQRLPPYPPVMSWDDKK